MADGPEEHLDLDLVQDLRSLNCYLIDFYRKENMTSTTCIHALLSCRCKRRIAPKGSIRLVGCRSCTPRPRCALSCAQVMRRAAVRSVKLEAAWMLHGLCFGEGAGARNLVFFRVKWLQPAMKGTSSVRRVRLGSFLSRIVPPMCFAASGCSCVRSSMRFLKLW